MDPTEDLSARVLLKHILSTDPPRTPITRSAVAPRRSSRLGDKDAGAKTPQDLLRRSLKQKLRESITRKSLPAPKRRTTSAVLRKSTSMLFDDGDTPRHILMNILRTDPVRSPVVHEKAASEEPQPSSANSSISSKRSSIEISGLSLPDITIGNAASTVKGLSRKRPRRSLNVTAFEKRLKHGTDISEENEESVDDHSSLSLSSSTSLSLKIPFGDARTEKRGLQRRVSNRRKITEEEFGAAVDKRQMGEVKSFVMAERGLSDTTYSEGFTLGLSKLSEPNITADIVHCDTALYAQPEAMTSSFSMVAPQDKPTVMASQLQRQLVEVEQEEPMEAEQSKLAEEKSAYLFPTEEGAVAEPQNEECFSQSEEDVDAAEFKKEERKSTAGGQPEDAAAMSKSEEDEAESQTRITDDTAPSEEKEKTMGAQTEEESDTDSQAEEDAATRSQSEEEEADSQTEEEAEGGVESQFEDDAATRSQSEEEEGTVDSQHEEEEGGGVDSQFEDDAATRSQSEEEEGTADSQHEEEEGGVDSQSEDDVAARSQSEEEEEEEEEEEGAVAVYQSDQEDPAEGGLTDSQPEDEHDDEEEVVEEEDDEQASGDLEGGLEHISRRTRLSAGGVMPVIKAGGDIADAGWSKDKSKAHGATDSHSSLEMGGLESSQPHTGIPDLTEGEPDADKENSFHPSTEDGEHLNDNRPKEAAAEDPAEQEEEWEEEEEESEEVPSKTPAFVREKRNMFYSDPLASPSVLKNAPASNSNEDLPAAKPKQVRKRAGPAKREAGLPKSYLMNVFKHFAKTKVSADVYPVLKETMDKFFERLAGDLEAYAHHAKRKTIEVEDAELLLKRQGYVNDKVPVEVLIEKYLRMDQRKLLIPIATSGNVVIPKKRR
ncbi:FK506-binding protein 5 isoform X2 [Larimichthys crocea]|uniref:FK506-binding protein 5 isoform X2 n=1 Tax=Larimichthys crocea TaxID=215358 RepID=UPI000F5F3F24|nr:centromere protein T isoform X2 [Larimichthys crocea]